MLEGPDADAGAANDAAADDGTDDGTDGGTKVEPAG
jgi:hypothetical protein